MLSFNCPIQYIWHRIQPQFSANDEKQKHLLLVLHSILIKPTKIYFNEREKLL